jgi:tetratricopeptide (TPR) repeat protein
MLSINDTGGLLWASRAAAYWKIKNYDAALFDYDKAIAIEPTARRYVERGKVRNRIDQYEGAISDFSEAIRLEPDDWYGRYCRCWTRAAKGIDLDRALVDCNEAIRLNPKGAAAYDGRALVHVRNKNWEKAFEDYSAADALSPNKAGYVYGMGISLLKMGKTDDGNAELVRARKLDPNVAAELEPLGLTL